MNLNGVQYYHIRNVQGDIIGLFDKAGTQVVSYVYDSWGKLISTDGSLKDTVGFKNSYRYRGYRYDSETGLYYLNSRYYNPEWGRFVNSDDIVGQTGQVFSHNMFSYCLNNPTNREDPSGYWSLKKLATAVAVVAVAALVVTVATAATGRTARSILLGALVGAASGALTNAYDQTLNGSGKFDRGQCIRAGLYGAASGMLGGSTIGIVGQVIGNALIGGVSTKIENSDAKGWKVTLNTLGGAVSGLLGGPGGQSTQDGYGFMIYNKVKNTAYAKATVKGITNASFSPFVISIGKTIYNYYRARFRNQERLLKSYY